MPEYLLAFEKNRAENAARRGGDKIAAQNQKTREKRGLMPPRGKRQFAWLLTIAIIPRSR
jgi:hypothetical protein